MVTRKLWFTTGELMQPTELWDKYIEKMLTENLLDYELIEWLASYQKSLAEADDSEFVKDAIWNGHDMKPVLVGTFTIIFRCAHHMGWRDHNDYILRRG